MFFYASKLFQALSRPGNVVFGLLVLSLLLLHSRFAVWGKRLLTLVTLGLLLLAVFPVGWWLLAPLETMIPASEQLPERIDGIITMGGVDPFLAAASGRPALNGDAECLTEVVALARRYPEARLVFTGGSGSLLSAEFGEASAAALFFAQQGVDLARFTWETTARGTHEKALKTFELLRPSASQTWVLITSAWRMPRTIETFETVGWKVVPWPVDHHAAGARTVHGDLAESLSWLGKAIKEWIGLAAYRLTGRGRSFFPEGPRDGLSDQPPLR